MGIHDEVTNPYPYKEKAWAKAEDEGNNSSLRYNQSCKWTGWRRREQGELAESGRMDLSVMENDIEKSELGKCNEIPTTIAIVVIIKRI